MNTIGTETVKDVLSDSELNKKSLCDYVVNPASGCLHACLFCYVPSTPVIRTRQTQLRERGVTDPQMDWGKYLFIREDLPERLELTLLRKRSWKETPSGRGVVLLSSGTDPYQNAQVARVTRSAVEVLLQHNKRVRILTRSPLWLQDLDLLVHPNVTVGMSIPHLDDALSRLIEPRAPLPSDRLKAMAQGHAADCRLYVAIAPVPPLTVLTRSLNQTVFQSYLTHHLEQMLTFQPEVMFFEPINLRGSNGKRMQAAGLNWADQIQSQRSWAREFLQQWQLLEQAADGLGCRDRLHIWTDPGLSAFHPQAEVEAWWYRPTPERWQNCQFDNFQR